MRISKVKWIAEHGHTVHLKIVRGKYIEYEVNI